MTGGGCRSPQAPSLEGVGGRWTFGYHRVIFKPRSMVPNPRRPLRVGFPKRGLVKECEDGGGERV